MRNEESATEYNNLQKVYSIWICMDVPLNSEYTITGYRMNRDDIYGHMASVANQRYDLMELVMVCLGRPEDAANGTELHQLLTVVLSDKLTPKEKIDIMRDDFNITTSVELEGGLAKMCNLSEYIEEKGLRRGIEQGIERGIEQGLTMGTYNTLFSLVQDGLLTPDVAAERAKLNLEEFEMLYQEYESK